MASLIEADSATLEGTLWLRQPLRVVFLNATYILKEDVEIADDPSVKTCRK